MAWISQRGLRKWHWSYDDSEGIAPGGRRLAACGVDLDIAKPIEIPSGPMNDKAVCKRCRKLKHRPPVGNKD